MLIQGANGKPITHTLVYGPTGSRKTTFLTTYPKPILCLAFDPYDKFSPFLKLGQANQYHDGGFFDNTGIEVSHVYDAHGIIQAQVEFYADPDPDQPQAYQKFLQRAPFLAQEAKQWGTIAVDSLTFYQYAYLRYDEKVMNPGYRDPRLWYGDLKREMVSQFLARFAWLPTNVVIIAHESEKEDKDEFATGVLRGVNVVGTLMKELPSGYGECYHAGVVVDAKTKEQRFMLQTQNNNLWSAASQIGAPNPCDMDYEKLWP